MTCAGKYMLAHAASAQGISAVENICGRKHTLNHLSVPAACFTHPEVSFVGLTEEAAREQAEKDGYKDKIAVTKTSFKANSKVCALPLICDWQCCEAQESNLLSVESEDQMCPVHSFLMDRLELLLRLHAPSR